MRSYLKKVFRLTPRVGGGFISSASWYLSRRWHDLKSGPADTLNQNPFFEETTRSLRILPFRLYFYWLVLLVAVFFYACAMEPGDNVFKRSTNRFEDQKIGQHPPLSEGGSPKGSESRKKINIHFSARYCLECHTSRNVDPQTKSLKFNGDFRKLCLDCHNERDPIHGHPVNVHVKASGGVRIPSDFPLQKEVMDCRTCHDVYIQCRDSESDRLLLKGQMLLRGLPYKSRLRFCYRCHDTGLFSRYNPHQQIDEVGLAMHDKCIYCHTDVPDESHTTYREVKLIGTYSELCKGCHYQTAKQPLHVRHLRKPTRDVVERMAQMQKEFKMVLPLDQDGNVTCVTCHNPHEKGLIPDQRAGAIGAGAPHRHRLAGNLCIKCHPMR